MRLLVAKGWRRVDCCTDEIILGLEEERDGNALREASVDFECIIGDIWFGEPFKALELFVYLRRRFFLGGEAREDGDGRHSRWTKLSRDTGNGPCDCDPEEDLTFLKDIVSVVGIFIG